MHWVIHKSVFSKPNLNLLVGALQRAELPYSLISFAADGEPIPDVQVDVKVFVCGAWKAQRLAASRAWVPGSFLNDNFSVEVWLQHLSDELLNDVTVFSTVEALRLEVPMFVRPVKDDKTFDGAVFTRESFETFRASSESLTTVEVSASPVRTIMREYRLFFVGGRVVTGSLYRRAGEVVLDSEVDPEAIAYAERVAQRWSPAEAFVMDVALTDEGYRVIEFNNINSSGFYAADVERYVDALERTFGD